MHIPLSTYRIQFTPDFGFENARRLLPYLTALGIKDIYASPILQCNTGSRHGYDVTDPTRLNNELGPKEAFTALIEDMKRRGLFWIQDIVPNHMAFSGENKILMDVLENGQNSPYFRFFHIDWNHPFDSINGKLLAPFLGAFYGVCLEKGEIQLKYDAEGITVNYYKLSFPLKTESYLKIITYKIHRLKKKLGKEHPDFIRFLGILYVLRTLGEKSEDEDYQDSYRQGAFIKQMLWECYLRNQDIRRFIDENIKTFNGNPNDPESFNLMNGLLNDQNFRLAFWKVASDEINYKRFFNVNGLISLRIEEDAVLDFYHSLIFRFIKEGKINGLRIDHIDGLYDPQSYLRILREKAGKIYTVVEKILETSEALPTGWKTEGTTGYDFLNKLNGLFCQSENEVLFTRIYQRFAGEKFNLDELTYQCKKMIIHKHMSGELDHLARMIKRISGLYRYGSDLTFIALKEALVEIMAAFPVYRTYINQDRFVRSERHLIESVLLQVKENNPELIYELNFLEKVFLLTSKRQLSKEESALWLDFVMNFQQYTGPLMAKGLEDTAFYIYNRLLSLNEVGSNPGRFGVSIEEFHRFNANRLKLSPHSMNATSTHDTKRGEDVRARLNVLSEIPKIWERTLKVWSNLNWRKKRKVKGHLAPNKNDEYLLYQTLIGTFPFEEPDNRQWEIYLERIKKYCVKAVREAKIHTEWVKPDSEYEEAFTDFIDRIFRKTKKNLFVNEFLIFSKKIAFFGIFNSLSQTLIKITSPGIPDFYRGAEMWDLTLVDPDNRRPVNYPQIESYLKNIKKKSRENLPELLEELLEKKEDGRIKLYLTYRALTYRTQNPELFKKGEYLPLSVKGTFSEKIVAYARRLDDNIVITVAPRFLTGMIATDNFLGSDIWQDTVIELPADFMGEWLNVLTGETLQAKKTVKVADILNKFPAGLLDFKG